MRAKIFLKIWFLNAHSAFIDFFDKIQASEQYTRTGEMIYIYRSYTGKICMQVTSKTKIIIAFELKLLSNTKQSVEVRKEHCYQDNQEIQYMKLRRLRIIPEFIKILLG